MRAQVVLLDGGKILLARHRRGDRSYWVLPGGAIEAGEDPEIAAVREVREESGLDVELLKLLFIDGPRHDGPLPITSPRFTYLGRVIGGRRQRIVDRLADEQRGHLDGTEWMPFDSDSYDAPTRDTLTLVQAALKEVNH